MSYFSFFPKIEYDFTEEFSQSTRILLTDISIRLKTKMTERDFILMTENVLITNESPEMLSYKLYQNPTYHWTFMLINEKYDYLTDWPMNDVVFNKFMIEKYGVEAQFEIHHYEDNYGNVVDGTTYIDLTKNNYSLTKESLPITNYDYEMKQNDLNRQIKVIQPQFLPAFVKRFKDKINE